MALLRRGLLARFESLPRRLTTWWYARSGASRLGIVVLGSLAGALLLATATSASNAFSLRSRTQVVIVEPSCGRSLVWDLPPGRFDATSASAAPPRDAPAAAATPQPLRHASVRIATGAVARIERVGERALSIRFERSAHFAACATADALVELRIDASKTPGMPADVLTIGRARGGADRIAFRSGAAAPAAAGADAPDERDRPTYEFALPLEGRIVIGAELPYGAGWSDADPPPLLDGADIQVRSLDGATGRSVGVLQEQVDSGGVIDSAPCFDHGPSLVDRTRLLFAGQAGLAVAGAARRHEACALAMAAPAFGVVRAHREGGLQAQVHVLAQHLGITAYQGQPRLLGVTLWQQLTHWHLAQALAAFVVLLGSAESAFKMFYRFRSAPHREPSSARGREPRSDAPPRSRRPRA
ncbi:MAG: hypothetical protein HS128_14030 [Ideonella sp.]|nr:hypothetical protein [Ideonella sp.]MCC7457310.1 hypothetical protein [Nitrospira sp.]